MEFHRPTWVLAIEQLDRAPQRLWHRRLRARVFGHLARERLDWILGALCKVEPTLERRDAEARHLARGRVSPAARGELLQARMQLTVLRWIGQQRADDRKSSLRPAQAQWSLVAIAHERRVSNAASVRSRPARHDFYEIAAISRNCQTLRVTDHPSRNSATARKAGLRTRAL